MSHARGALEGPFRRRSDKMGSSSMRARLRAATTAAHERMHAHSGFAAAATGAIAVTDYRLLLARVYGFHRPFEAVVREAAASLGFVDFDIEGRARSPALLADLETLGLDARTIARLPLWVPSRSFASKGALLGALYVLEGSTLGGAKIARALQGVIGGEAGDGRCFFLGRGDQQSSMWREFLARLEALSESPEESAEAIEAAVVTFDDFETWMEGWRVEREFAPAS
jgi:heme oxygenase (biliverdin-IX-beta and delta-forming)